MSIEDLLIPNRVVRNIKAGSKKLAIDIMSEILTNSVEGIDSGEVFQSLIAREKLGSTAAGHGVAIPHGRLETLEQSIGALLKLTVPLEFDAPDQEPVDLLFGLLVPQECAEGHLQDLAGIARLLSDPKLRAELRAAPSSTALYDTLCHYRPMAQATGG